MAKQINEIELDKDSYTSRTMSRVERLRLTKKLVHLMEKEKIYTNPNLTVEDVVELLESNTTYFYYFLRDVFGCRFYSYVNTYRINEAKRMLVDTKKKINVIATSCGFNSNHTLTRVFKQYTGMLPSEYRALNRP